MEKPKTVDTQVWLPKDGPVRHEDWQDRHVGPTDRCALSILTSDNVTTIVNGRWFADRTAAKTALAKHEFVVINRLMDLLHGLVPREMPREQMLKVTSCANQVGQSRWADLLTLALSADDYLNDHLTLQNFIDQMSQIQISKAGSSFSRILTALASLSDTQNPPNVGEFLFAAGCPVMCTVIAKAMVPLVDLRAYAIALLVQSSDSKHPHAEKLRRDMGIKQEELPIEMRAVYREAQNGGIKAQMSLADYYSRLPSTSQDEAKRIQWLGMAAVQNHAPASLELARFFAHDDTPHWPRAISYYQRAADLGNNEAMVELASILLDGNAEVKRDPKRALALLTTAAKAGHKGAKRVLKANNQTAK